MYLISQRTRINKLLLRNKVEEGRETAQSSCGENGCCEQFRLYCCLRTVAVKTNPWMVSGKDTTASEIKCHESR